MGTRELAAHLGDNGADAAGAGIQRLHVAALALQHLLQLLLRVCRHAQPQPHARALYGELLLQERQCLRRGGGDG
jgi:hypothetical protein